MRANSGDNAAADGHILFYIFLPEWCSSVESRSWSAEKVLKLIGALVVCESRGACIVALYIDSICRTIRIRMRASTLVVAAKRNEEEQVVAVVAEGTKGGLTTQTAGRRKSRRLIKTVIMWRPMDTNRSRRRI